MSIFLILETEVTMYSKALSIGSIVIAAGICLAACTKSPEPQDTVPQQSSSEITSLEFNLPSYRSVNDEPDSKVLLEWDESSIAISFEATDTLGVYPDDGSQIYFKTSGTSGQSVAFDGGAWKMKMDATYYSYYPFVGDIYLDKTKVPVRFDGQSQDGNTGSISGMRSSFSCIGTPDVATGKVTFDYVATNCFINVNATLPAGTYTKMHLKLEEPLFVKRGTVDVTQATPSITPVEMTDLLTLDLENCTLPSEGVLAAFVSSAPVNLNGKHVNVYFLDSEGFVYKQQKTPSREYLAGNRYGLTCKPVLDDGYSFGIAGWTQEDVIEGIAE